MNCNLRRLLLPLLTTAGMTIASLATPLTSATPAQASEMTASDAAIDSNAVFTLQSTNQLSALAPRNDATGHGEVGNDVPILQDQSDGPYPGRTEQMWRFILIQSNTTPIYEVMNVQSNKCLSVFYNGTTVGTQLVQYDCHAWPDQQWTLKRLPRNMYSLFGYQLQSVSSNLWMGGPTDYEMPDASAPNGLARNTSPLRLDTAANALSIYPKQLFSVTRFQKYRLTTANSLVLDAAPGADDAPVVQNPVQLWQEQSWTFDPQADGSYTLVNSRTGECLSIYYGSTAAGAGLVQYTCHSWTDQEWDIVPVLNPFGIGYSLTLKSRLSGMVVDVPGDTIIQRTQFDQWPSTGGINQRFVVTAV